MKVCACICELNPFHNGHEYLFREARRLTGADHIVAVMSGDFVQRGLPAICDKYARTTQALMGGADLVVELPVMYATASADYFAQGGVSSVVNMGCVDSLVFGSECGDLEFLMSCAGQKSTDDPGLHILSQGAQSESTKNFRITKLLKEGMSYAKAYAAVTGNEFAPNDMLAVRYLRSLNCFSSDIEPFCVKRTGGGYNDPSKNAFSALSVRSRVRAGEDFAHLVPKYVYRNLQSIAGASFPVYLSDLSIQLYTTISNIIDEEKETDENILEDFMDVSANIAGRIRANIGRYKDIDGFVSLVHSKEYTKGRIYRALLHILLDIRKADYPYDPDDCSVSYIRILGFRKAASALLSTLKEQCVVPVISKSADASSILDDEAAYLFSKDVKAANIYDMAAVFKFGKEPEHEFTKEVVLI